MWKHILFNVIQALTVLIFSPLMVGILHRLKEVIQSKKGPSIFQPYRDLRKLFSKDEVVSEESTWIFRFTPYLTFVAPLIVSLLIPVLTDYPLFWAFMADMVGAGFILALAGFFGTLAAVDTGNPYGPVGASRTRMVGFLAEPTFLVVFFSVSFISNCTIPFIVQQHWVHPLSNFFNPAHLLLLVSFFMLILAEKGRIPVDNPSGHFELAMIDESKGLEYSGKGAALMKWGGWMKFFVLMTIFLNVLVTPWGLASKLNLSDVLLAIPLVLLKMFFFIVVLVIVESSLAKLRLFRIPEFMSAAFVIAVIAMLTSVFS
jgi:formate hydrogenlyase subunit 4